MAYKTYLDTEEWRKRRLEIINRDNNKCQCSTCDGKSNTLEVHHLEYLSYELKPYEYPNDMLITLCSRCHRSEKMRFKHEDMLLTALKSKGFLVSDLIALTTRLYSDTNFTKELLYTLRLQQNG